MSCAITGKAALILGLLLAVSEPAAAARVDAARYSAFWLWGSSALQKDVLDKAQSLYFLQGEIRRQPTKPETSVVVAQGASVPQNLGCDVWLVYRATTLNWPDEAIKPILSHLERWREAGNKVVGLQIDFDSATPGLSKYAAALRALRTKLPPSYRLGITGLLDWANNGDADTIGTLRDTIDEVVLQTYQGRSTIANYADYLNNLDRLRMPYRIGLVQSGVWQENPSIEASPWFRGYVVFLVGN